MLKPFRTQTLFVRAFFLAGSQACALAITVLTAPILSRLYTPAEYGVLSLTMATAALLSAIATLALPEAMIVERSDKAAYTLGIIVRIFSVTVGLLSLTVSLTGYFIFNLSAEAVTAGLFASLVVGLSGWSGTNYSISARNAKFKELSYGAVIAPVVGFLTSFVAASSSLHSTGLILGYAANSVAVMLWNSWCARTHSVKQFRLNRRVFLAILSRYRAYMVWRAPSLMVGSITLNLPVYLLSFQSALDIAGAFGRARQLVAVPLSVAGNAVAQVFLQNAAKRIEDRLYSKKSFITAFWLLVMTGLPPSLIILFFAPQIFEFYLGSKWVMAGHISSIMMPMLYLQFVAGPLSQVLIVHKMQRLDAMLKYTFSALTTVLTILPMVAGCAPIYGIVGFTIAQGIMFIVYLYASFKLIGRGI